MKRVAFSVVFLFALIMMIAAPAAAQSLGDVRTLFVIGDHNGVLTWPLRAYSYINDQLIVADTWRPITRDTGPTGLAVDPYNEHLFVSYENSPVVDVFDATDATPQGQISLVGTSNLAGMDIHEGRGQFFVVDRAMMTVFVFDTDTFSPIDSWALPSGAGAWDLELVENLDGRDVLFVSDYGPTIRWYDIDTHEEVGNVTQHSAAEILGIGIYIKDNGQPVIFTASASFVIASSPYLTKIDVESGQETTKTLGGTGRGVDVNQNAAQVFVAVGNTGFASKPHVSVYDVETLNEITRADLQVNWSPCDVKSTWLSFGSSVKKECTSHPTGEINMTEDVVFTITVTNRYSRPIHVLPLADQYDTTQLTFVSSTPAVDDPTDDGEVGWADLIPTIGHDLATDEQYTVTLNFKAEPEGCTSGSITGENLGLMHLAQDDRGDTLDDASGTFAYKIWCNCVVDADCDDGVYCNGAEHCVNKQCTSDGNPCPVDDGVYCNGEETITCVEATKECGHTGDPCAAEGTMCEPVVCDEETLQCLPGDDPCPDDGLFCNGDESCAENKVDCQHSGNPCNEGEVCDEETDACTPFNIDDDTEAPPVGDDEEGWPEGKVTGGCCGCG